MKKLLALILVAIFLFNTEGYYFIFLYRHFSVRREIHNLINEGFFDESYTLLKIIDPKVDQNFERINESEFRYEGVLYDIISEYSDGNVSTFHCVNDKQEERLLSRLVQKQEFVFGRNAKKRTNQARAMIYHIIKLALVRGSIAIPLNSKKGIKYFEHINFPVLSFYKLIYTPPKFVV